NGWIEAWLTSTNATGEDITDLYFTTYSHRQDYPNPSSATETPNSPPNSGKPLCNASKLNWTCQLPFTHKQMDQQKSQTKPSFKFYETEYQQSKTTEQSIYHLSHTQSIYLQTIQPK